MSTNYNEKRQNKRGQLMLVGLAACAFVATLVSPAAVQAQVITLSRTDIEDMAETAMECYIHPNGPGCDRNDSDSQPACALYWASGAGSADRVRVSRKNANTINADIHMKCSIGGKAVPDPDVYIHLDLVFSCYWRDPSVKVSPADVDIDVDWPWYWDVATLPFGSPTWWIGNIKSRTVTSKVRASGAVQDFTEEQMVPLNYCPGINVQRNGDVQIDLAMGNECTNGQTRHRRCSSTHFGPGLDYVCVGGRWGFNGGWCEPKAPPGGHQP
jgi:hypothetical protein